ncbi:hypothetical protein BEN30_01475 [Magnetovibrio blakemorei]|uniref:DUF2946 domain-containing protein n=1 Tax=Magnetovibrio blakemorei TaxID=28181 RepID=A0A1E5Q3T4_9PROT|nr:hypothetical protein BEN30_01475 [Magnetovibrio blakemorei]
MLGAIRKDWGRRAAIWLLTLVLSLGHGVAMAAPAFVPASSGVSALEAAAIASNGLFTAADTCSTVFQSSTTSNGNPVGGTNAHDLCVYHCTLSGVALAPQLPAVQMGRSVFLVSFFSLADENLPAFARLVTHGPRAPPAFSS